MGSKARIAKYILPIILKGRKPDQWYVEPFVGGANLIDKVDGNRLGADSNKYLIACLKQIRDDFSVFPKDNSCTSEGFYKSIKTHKDVCDSIYGYYGFALSYGGKWFGGWRRDSKGIRDYVSEAYRNAKKQSVYLQDVVFKYKTYADLYIPENSIIYCDPPYADTTKYKDAFNHSMFWQWCRDKATEGHMVYVSEYNAPPDFECVWEKEIVSSLTKDTGNKKGTERLFIYRSDNEQ